MKISFRVLTLSLCLVVTGCTKDSAASDGCDNCIDSAAVTSTVIEDGLLKKGFMVDEFTPISAILADREKFEGKRLKVKGEVVQMCKKKGCWIGLKSEKANDKSLRVKVEDGVIIFPAEIEGHEVTAEGVFVKVVYPAEKIRENKKALAEKNGEEFDETQEFKPVVQWQLHGICAECPGTKWKS